MAGRPGKKLRFWIIALVFVFGYGAIGYRLVDLHALRAPELVSELQKSRHRVITQNPRRGEIFDANGELLATSQTFLEVGVDPSLARQEDIVLLPELAKLLGISRKEVEKSFGVRRGNFISEPISSAVRWRLLKKRITETQYSAIQALGIRCVYGSRSYKRVYPKGELAAHVVGYVREDGEAAYGTEREYDFYLSGQRGWKESEVGGRRGEMAQFRRRQVDSIDGLNISLTIDSYVQDAVEDELRWIGKNMKPESASIIVTDPYSGYILGMANYPTYDPNHYGSAPLSAQRNRALTDPIEPGSTFKIVAASGALEERLVSIYDKIDCSKTTMVMPNGYVAKLPKDSHSNGVLSVAEVVSRSSNRGAAQLGLMLGEQGFHDYAAAFGFGERTGFGMGQESKGLLHPVKKWDGLTLSRITMGHSISATPLQIHFATATIANRGILMKPQIVSRITNIDGSEVVRFGPVPRRRVVSRSTANTVAALLEKTASQGGTALAASIPGFHVAGKTGTTQKIINGRYSRSQHVGSFSGFFPANNPQVVITVIVDGANVPGLAYGSKVAAPSFKRIALKLIPHYAIVPSDKTQPIAFHGN